MLLDMINEIMNLSKHSTINAGAAIYLSERLRSKEGFKGLIKF